MKRQAKVRVKDQHRNGVCGVPFTVAIVDEIEDGVRREMLVVRFEKASDKGAGGVLCAAFDLAKLDKRDIEFGSNSWRGDHYADTIDRSRSLTRTDKRLAGWLSGCGISKRRKASA